MFFFLISELGFFAPPRRIILRVKEHYCLTLSPSRYCRKR